MESVLLLQPSLGRHAVRPAGTAIRLAAAATLAGRLPAGACVTVLSGRVWLTQTGDANDYFVDAGQRHVVARGGRVVIESLTAQAVLRVLPEATAARPGFP
jgi:ferric-dicitrate binding protein FerR (iron transport regulator)